MSFCGLIQTKYGRNELAKAEMGERYEFTDVWLGDGEFNGSFVNKIELEHAVIRLQISSVKRKESEVIIECDFNSKSAPTAFFLREVGIFANGKLCYYDNAGTEAEYIDPGSSEIVKQKRMRFVLAISSEVKVTVNISEGLYALEDDLVDHASNPVIHMTEEEKEKLQRIENEANKYVHPSNHPASMITQDSEHRFMTDAEKITWNATYEQGTAYTDKAIGELINGAPETLDTLKEVADAIQENETVVDALDAAIGTKANKAEVDTHTGNGTVHITAVERSAWNGKAAGIHYHDDRYYTEAEVTNLLTAKAPVNHASTGTGHGIGNAKNYGHVKLSDDYVDSVGAAASGIGISQQAAHALAEDLVKRISNVSSNNTAGINNLKIEIARALMGYVSNSGGSVNGLLTLAGGLEIVAGAVNIASVIRTANNKGVYGATTGGTDVNLARVSAANDIQLGASGYNTYIYGPSGKSLSIISDRFIPGTDDGLYCGDSSHRWKRFYAVNGTINTSDRNYKKDIRPIPEKFEQMFLKLKPTIFKFLDGDRDHIGAISQDVWETMKGLGIKDTEFAGFCRDIKMKDIIDPDTKEVAGQEPVLDADGNPEYIYSLCYQEFIFLIAHMVQKLWGKQEKENEMMRSELNEVKAEIAELKSLSKSRA